jgi:broad specificity phosphatase PhoE
MKIYFVRHGHSDHNAAFDKAQDRIVYRSFQYKESHLTEKGVQQMKNTVLPLKMDRVYSSPIIRCIETSRLLVGNDTILYLHDGLMESQGPYPCNWRPDIDSLTRSLGRYILKDVNTKYEPYIKYYLPDVSETSSEIKERATKTLEQIKNECANLENVMIVSHNDLLESLFDRPFSNGEVYIVEY